MLIRGSASNATDKDSTSAVKLSNITGLLVQFDHLLLCADAGSEAAFTQSLHNLQLADVHVELDKPSVATVSYVEEHKSTGRSYS